VGLTGGMLFGLCSGRRSGLRSARGSPLRRPRGVADGWAPPPVSRTASRVAPAPPFHPTQGSRPDVCEPVGRNRFTLSRPDPCELSVRGPSMPSRPNPSGPSVSVPHDTLPCNSLTITYMKYNEGITGVPGGLQPGRTGTLRALRVGEGRGRLVRGPLSPLTPALNAGHALGPSRHRQSRPWLDGTSDRSHPSTGPPNWSTFVGTIIEAGSSVEEGTIVRAQGIVEVDTHRGRAGPSDGPTMWCLGGCGLRVGGGLPIPPASEG
jgi:hypothetical protein